MRSVTILARRPRPGTVKSRLSPALPPNEACRLYRGMLLDAITAARESSADRRVVHWADPPGDGSEDTPGLAESLGAGLGSALQRGNDLGDRLAAAFEDLLQAPEDRAVAIGADCPELDGVTVDAGLAALERHDLVLAPAADGGYALVGLARPAPELFRGVAWGGAAVLEQTRARADRLGLRVALLPTLRDLDTPVDLVGWIARTLADTDRRGAQTAMALAELGLLPQPA